jgi:phage-related protein
VARATQRTYYFFHRKKDIETIHIFLKRTKSKIMIIDSRSKNISNEKNGRAKPGEPTESMTRDMILE